MYLLLVMSLLYGHPGGDLNGDGPVDLLDYAWVQTHDDWRETQAALERLALVNAGVNRARYVIADTDGRALMTCEMPVDDHWANVEVDIFPGCRGVTIRIDSLVRVEVRRR